MADKLQFEAAVALRVAAELCKALKPVCNRLVVAGSLRRRKPLVGDVEILYIGKTEMRLATGSLFGEMVPINLADREILSLRNAGILERRKNIKGSETYGPKIKLMRHVATGVPVDFFTATEANWWNYLVCRTGSAENNIRIASAAKHLGWQWNPFGAGFSRNGETKAMNSEEEVFKFVGLSFLLPKDR